MEIILFDQTVKIELDVGKKIGIMLSGGMDSAALLFLILKEIKDKNLDIDLRVFNVPNVNDNAEVHSRKVVDYLENYFKIGIDITHIGDGKAEPLKLIRIPSTDLIKNKIIDVLYSAQNQFPPEAEEWESYKESKSKFVRRNPNLPDLDQAKYPFIRLYKHHILEMYRIFDLLELLKITHSCTQQKEGKCGSCLWCEERTWAFSKLKMLDLS